MVGTGKQLTEGAVSPSQSFQGPTALFKSHGRLDPFLKQPKTTLGPRQEDTRRSLQTSGVTCVDAFGGVPDALSRYQRSYGVDRLKV
jgi:hypothetical protein